MREIGGRALAGVAVVAGDDQRLVEVGVGDEVGQGVIVQVVRAADMAEGEALWVADVHHHGALFAQGLGLLGGDALEFTHGGSPRSCN
ncbi:hypothetical protein D3C80_1750070 [compost metagenome]